MTRPTAPCLTADYHTYSAHLSGDDYYGGFQLDNENMEHMRNSAPIRREFDSAVSKSRKQEKRTSAASAHCITFIYLSISLIFLGFSYILYHSNVKNKIVFYCTAISVGYVVSSFLMHIGIIRQQPFFCIPFVVLRTLETFISGFFMTTFTIANLNHNGDIFNFYLQCTKIILQLVSPHFKLETVDATTQLCMAGLCVSLAIFSVSLYVCRVSFQCTVSIADRVRYKRCQNQNGLSQSRFAGDEFYCS